MRKFLKRTAIVFIAVICLLGVMDWRVSNRLKNSPYREFAAWHDLMQGDISSAVVILGSSRAWVHYSPAIIDSILNCDSYNLGIDGSHMNRQITKYRLFRLYNNKPELIILNLDYFSFEYTYGYESYQYFPYFYDKNVRKIIFPQENFSLAEKYIPYYRYFKLGLNQINYDPDVLYKGYHGQEQTWDGSKLNKMQPYYVGFDDRTVDAFEDFVQHTQKDSIPIIMVFSPIYYKARELTNNKNQFDEFLAGLGRKHNIPILRYDDDPICLDTTYFYNATHLNKLGSEIFSRKVATDIRDYLHYDD